MCGFTDVVKREGKYVCAKCNKPMPPDWEHHVIASGRKPPAETK